MWKESLCIRVLKVGYLQAFCLFFQGVFSLKKTYFEPRYILLIPTQAEKYIGHLKARGLYTQAQMDAAVSRIELYANTNRQRPGFFDNVIPCGTMLLLLLFNIIRWLIRCIIIISCCSTKCSKYSQLIFNGYQFEAMIPVNWFPVEIFRCFYIFSPFQYRKFEVEFSLLWSPLVTAKQQSFFSDTTKDFTLWQCTTNSLWCDCSVHHYSVSQRLKMPWLSAVQLSLI